MEIDRDAPVYVEREVDIAAPIEVVWDVLTSVDEVPRWFSEGESVTLSGPLAPGTTMRMKGRGTGTITATLATVERPHAFEWTSRTFGISAISVWRLEASGDRTRVTKGESMNGFPARALRTSLRRKTESFMDTWLRDLKAEAERRAS